MNNASFKDLEQVRLKATYNMKIGNKNFEEGETIAFFDKIQVAGLQELQKTVSAKGGFDNRSRVFWTTTEQIQLNFIQGVFSQRDFALMNNAAMIENDNNASILPISFREELESNELGEIECKYLPIDKIFIYSAETGEKLSYTQNDKILTIETPFLSVIVDYNFNYKNKNTNIKIGQRLLSGYLALEGVTRVKDDTTGQVVTGIIKIPRLMLMSDLSIRLGSNVSPIVANFSAIGVPVGSRGNSHVLEFNFLSDDIHSDL